MRIYVWKEAEIIPSPLQLMMIKKLLTLKRYWDKDYSYIEPSDLAEDHNPGLYGRGVCNHFNGEGMK